MTDFGVAKALDEAGPATAVTATGLALGTPTYMAPEQAAGDPHTDQRADIYALGVLGYEMLAGRPPFLGASPQAIVAAQLTQAPPPLTHARTSVPPALASLIMRCLEKRPADRPQSAEELVHALEALGALGETRRHDAGDTRACAVALEAPLPGAPNRGHRTRGRPGRISHRPARGAGSAPLDANLIAVAPFDVPDPSSRSGARVWWTSCPGAWMAPARSGACRRPR